MYKVDAYQIQQGLGIVKPLTIKRDWMENTWESHAYKCFPVGLTNQLGWSISFPEDISFIWDGINDSNAEHVKILSGEKYAYAGRANATISFKTGVRLVTSESISMLCMPVPNLFFDGATPFTTIISSSFFPTDIPVAWMITKPNEIITIKAGTPITSMIPINLNDLQNSEINFKNLETLPKVPYNESEYSSEISKLNSSGVWSNFYRDAVDHKKESIGSHQVKTIRLFVNSLE